MTAVRRVIDTAKTKEDDWALYWARLGVGDILLSRGDLSAAMAAYAARAGLRSLVLIPDGKIAWGKLSQAMDYGAVTCQLKTDFDGCLKLLTQIVKEAPIYLLNSVNPYRLEGQKTPAFEIAETRLRSETQLIAPHRIA